MGLGESIWEAVEWIHLAQDTDWWRAVVNTVMNIRVHCATELLSCKYAPY
jgi:hypothetical protein